MNRSGADRVQYHAARTATPGTTRQATTTTPLGTRSVQYRAAEMQRGAPAQRADDPAPDKDDDENEKRPAPDRNGTDDDEKDPKDKGTDPAEDDDDDPENDEKSK